VALIDADDACSAFRDVVQSGFGHFKPDAGLLQPSGHRAARVMQRPACDPAAAIEPSFGFAPAREHALFAGKHEVWLVVDRLFIAFSANRGATRRIVCASGDSGTR
jgi:hypothetical protein